MLLSFKWLVDNKKTDILRVERANNISQLVLPIAISLKLFR